MIPKLSLEQAQKTRCCRICGEAIANVGGQPKGWMEDFGEMMYPLRITLNFGEEFAHTKCLEDSKVEDSKVDGPQEPIIDLYQDKIGVIYNVGDAKQFLDSLPDSMPLHLIIGRKMVSPVFSVEKREDVLKRNKGIVGLEIREG